MKISKKKLKGYSLAELVLAIGIFAIISSMLVFLVIDATRTLENTRTRSKASQLTQEVYTSLILVKSQGWYNIAKYTNDGIKHLEYADGTYNILDGETVQDNLTYSFTIEEVQRDTQRNLVTEGGTNDPHTRLISIYISWVDRIGKVHTINPQMYVNDWNTHSIVWTTQAEFDTGVFTETMSELIDDGEVRLFSMKYSDWCNPTLSLSAHDLTRSGVASALFTINDYVYMGTGGNQSGPAFSKVSVIGDPPVVSELGLYDGHKVYDVFGLNGYAIIGTDTNAKELVVLDISSPDNIYTEFTYLDLPNPGTKQKYVYVYENLGYITHDANITIFRVDNLQLNVTPTVVQTINVGGSNAVISDIYVDSQYIYVTTQGVTSDFYILQNSAPYSVLGQIDLGLLNASSLFISEDLNRAYIGTLNNTGNEFFILDISNKSGTYTVINSQDLGGMSVTALVSADKRVMIGGVSSGEEYVVYNISDEIHPFKCGGLNIDAGINMITLVTKEPNLYTYVLTRDSYKELQIIKGGPGGGGPDGEGYVEAGEYLSEIHDSASESSEYYILSLEADIPTGTSLKIQFRVSSDPTMTGSSWVGPDGTSNTYYDTAGVYTLPLLAGRYLQYKVIFSSDTINTPLLKELIINYEK